MKPVVLFSALLCASACTKIIHAPPPDAGGTGGTTGGVGGAGGSGGGGPIGHVQMLWQFNLPRTAVNLAPGYARFHDGLIAALTNDKVAVDQTGVAGQYGPVQLVWGASDRAQPNKSLSDTLRAAADSGLYEPPAPGSQPEQQNLEQLGANLGQLTIPPPLVGGDSIPLYGPARDAFVVVTVHSTRRLCALGDGSCQLAGQSPIDYFAVMRGDGTAAWIQPIGASAGVPQNRIVFVDIVTSEGESTQQFQTRCAAVPGFSRTLLDVMEPSPVVYYGDFASQAGAHGMFATRLDLCNALGDPGVSMLQTVALEIAQRVAGH